MGWKAVLIMGMAVLTGGGALPPPDCGNPMPLGYSSTASLDVPEPTTLTGSFGLSPAMPSGCQGLAIPVISPLTSLRNEERDVLHGLQPARDLRSPVDTGRPNAP